MRCGPGKPDGAYRFARHRTTWSGKITGKVTARSIEVEALEAAIQGLDADLQDLAQRHDCIGDVRQFGLFLGVELVHGGDPSLPAAGFTTRVVNGMKARGVLISNFFTTPTPSFRVGCIGAVSPADMRYAVAAMAAVLHDYPGLTREKLPSGALRWRGIFAVQCGAQTA